MNETLLNSTGVGSKKVNKELNGLWPSTVLTTRAFIGQIPRVYAAPVNEHLADSFSRIGSSEKQLVYEAIETEAYDLESLRTSITLELNYGRTTLPFGQIGHVKTKKNGVPNTENIVARWKSFALLLNERPRELALDGLNNTIARLNSLGHFGVGEDEKARELLRDFEECKHAIADYLLCAA
jgi:hypothetical protein